LSVGGGEDGGDGGRAGDGDLGKFRGFRGLGPLVQVFFVVPASVVGSGEPVANDTGLLLRLGLGSTLDLALVEATLDADGEGVWDLEKKDDTCEKI
jgi:hypothetical protein